MAPASSRAVPGRHILLAALTFVLALSIAPSALAGGGGSPKVVTGADHTCALTDRGTVLCWGLNDAGQLGTGDTTNQPAPTLVPSLTEVKSLAAHARGTCAVKHDGTAWCWGANHHGQLGQGVEDADPHPVPVQVVGVKDTYWVSGGTAHLCSVTWKGVVSCWGSNSDGQLGNGGVGGATATATPIVGVDNIHSLATGGDFTCVSVGDKKVRCWGANATGQLGGGASGASSGAPLDVAGLESAYSLIAGAGHACALTWSKVQVRCWGDNSLGQIAQGTTGEAAPRGVSDVTTVKEVKQLGGTAGSTCALLENRTPACWGDGSNGRLGVGNETSSGTPVAVGLTDVAALSAGSTSRTQCAIQRGGILTCWGANDSGQAGVGAASGPLLTPAVVPSVDLVTRPQYPESAWVEPTSQMRRNKSGTKWRLKSRLTVEPSWFVFPEEACKGSVAADVFYWRKVKKRPVKKSGGDGYEKRKIGVRTKSELRLSGGLCKASFVHRIPIAKFASKKKQLLLSATGFGNDVQSKFTTGEYELKNMNRKK